MSGGHLARDLAWPSGRPCSRRPRSTRASGGGAPDGAAGNGDTFRQMLTLSLASRPGTRPSARAEVGDVGRRSSIRRTSLHRADEPGSAGPSTPGGTAATSPTPWPRSTSPSPADRLPRLGIPHLGRARLGALCHGQAHRDGRRRLFHGKHRPRQVDVPPLLLVPGDAHAAQGRLPVSQNGRASGSRSSALARSEVVTFEPDRRIGWVAPLGRRRLLLTGVHPRALRGRSEDQTL